MSLALDDLPRNPDGLLQRLRQMAEVIARQNAGLISLQAERDTARSERDAAQAEIEKLRLLIRQLQRGQFGRRSEKLDPDQLQLGLEDLEQAAAAAEAAQDGMAARDGTPRAPRVRRRNLGALPAHLPRIEVLLDVEDKSCPCCGGTLHVIGESREEMLDIVPAQLRVKVIRRPRYACRACEEAVVQAPAPERPITGGMATEALLAHVLVAKYADFLPLYRQAGIFARQGVELDRSTLCDWVGRACWWLEPLWRLLRRHVMASTRIFADDTTLPVLDPGRGRTKTGRLWGYAIDDRPWGGATPPAVVYLYAEDRKGEHPATHLAGFRGVLQVDGYGGFKSLLESRPPGEIRLAFCWAHCRDDFTRSTRPPARRWRKRRCAGSGSSTRSRRRSAAARPSSGSQSGRSAANRSWTPCTPGSPPSWGGCRAGPAWRRRSATPCATGPGWCCSSRTAGSSWTPTASSGRSGRSAWDARTALFAGSDGGACWWAIVASLVATAKLNGVEPLAWLTDVLERVVSGRTKAHELERLLPWTWQAEQLAAAGHA